LLCFRDERGDDWADIIDFLTLHPEARRKARRLLGEMEAADQRYEDGPGGRTERTRPSFALGALRPAPHLA
jgi:hypothetical protein